MNEARTRTHDALGRRYRDRPHPTGKRIRLTDRTLLLFEKLHRHGPLPSSFLRGYSRLVRRSEGRTLDLLTDLFNEDNTPHGGWYLDRPWQQFSTLDPRGNEIVYDITTYAQAALEETGRSCQQVPSTSPISWKHDVMCSCITSSIELAVLQQPDIYAYIFHDEIVGKIGTFAFPVSVSYKNKAGSVTTDEKVLRPDRAFGIRYKQTGAARIFLVEADCSTEPNNASGFNRKSHRRSILQYNQFIGRGDYKKYFGEGTRVMLLSAFASEAKMDNVKNLLLELSDGKGSALMLFNAWTSFARHFTPPKPRQELFTAPWNRAGYEPFNISKP